MTRPTSKRTGITLKPWQNYFFQLALLTKQHDQSPKNINMNFAKSIIRKSKCYE